MINVQGQRTPTELQAEIERLQQREASACELLEIWFNLASNVHGAPKHETLAWLALIAPVKSTDAHDFTSKLRLGENRRFILSRMVAGWKPLLIQIQGDYKYLKSRNLIKHDIDDKGRFICVITDEGRAAIES